MKTCGDRIGIKVDLRGRCAPGQKHGRCGLAGAGAVTVFKCHASLVGNSVAHFCDDGDFEKVIACVGVGSVNHVAETKLHGLPAAEISQIRRIAEIDTKVAFAHRHALEQGVSGEGV